MEFKPENLIVALDVPTPAAAEGLIFDLGDTGCSFKLGQELASVLTNSPTRSSQLLGKRPTFRDGKYFDIQNTVVGAIAHDSKSLKLLFETVPLPGNHLAFRDAVKWGNEHDPDLLILAVGILTSYTDADVIRNFGGRFKTAAEAQLHYAQLALEMAEGHPIGMVFSPTDLPLMQKHSLLERFKARVCPGIRPAGAVLNDQKRVGTPVEALRAGATHLVIGRPITGAPNPVAALESILAEIAAA